MRFIERLQIIDDDHAMRHVACVQGVDHLSGDLSQLIRCGRFRRESHQHIGVGPPRDVEGLESGQHASKHCNEESPSSQLTQATAVPSGKSDTWRASSVVLPKPAAAQTSTARCVINASPRPSSSLGRPIKAHGLIDGTLIFVRANVMISTHGPSLARTTLTAA